MLELLHERFCDRTVNTVPSISKLVCIECCLHFAHLFPMHVRRSWIKPWGAVNQTGQWCLLSHCCVRFNSPANVRRIGGGDDAACLLGAGVLPAATRLRQGPSGRRMGPGVQMDRILYRCWQERTLYDASVYLQALKHRGSSLIYNLAKAS